MPTVATLAALAAASGHGNVAEHEAPWCAGNQAVKFCLQEPPDDSAGGDYDDRHKPLAPETAQLVAKTVAFLAERLPSTSNKLVINAWDEDASTWLRALGPHGAWLQHIGLLQRCTEELHLSRLAFVEGDLAALAVTLQSLQVRAPGPCWASCLCCSCTARQASVPGWCGSPGLRLYSPCSPCVLC